MIETSNIYCIRLDKKPTLKSNNSPKCCISLRLHITSSLFNFLWKRLSFSPNLNRNYVAWIWHDVISLPANVRQTAILLFKLSQCVFRFFCICFCGACVLVFFYLPVFISHPSLHQPFQDFSSVCCRHLFPILFTPGVRRIVSLVSL